MWAGPAASAAGVEEDGAAGSLGGCSVRWTSAAAAAVLQGTAGLVSTGTSLYHTDRIRQEQTRSPEEPGRHTQVQVQVSQVKSRGTRGMSSGTMNDWTVQGRCAGEPGNQWLNMLLTHSQIFSVCCCQSSLTPPTSEVMSDR